MEVNDTLVEDLCRLACLEFDPAGRQEIKEDLQKIIGFVEKLNELDLEGVEPLLNMGDEVDIFREDIPGESMSREAALKNATWADEQYFKVPQVVKNPSPNRES